MNDHRIPPEVTPAYARYRGNPPENYERHFVPVIGAPCARPLLEAAHLSPGEAVLDVASDAGFLDVGVESRHLTLHLPPPADFFWQYVHSSALTVPRPNCYPPIQAVVLSTLEPRAKRSCRASWN